MRKSTTCNGSSVHGVSSSSYSETLCYEFKLLAPSMEVGLGGSLETLCGQAFGAELYGLLGVYLQSSCSISILFSILISILWLFTEPILILFHQDHNISKMAALYIKYLIPGLFAYGLMNCLLRFLQTQSVVIPLIFCSVLPLIMHVGITYILVHCTSLGFVGAPLATSISFWIAFFMLVVYVLHAKKFKKTWQGFSLESFCHVLPNLKLALPSAAMLCLEYWALEVMVILAGLLPNPEITTPLMAICTNTETAAYMVVYGLSAAVRGGKRIRLAAYDGVHQLSNVLSHWLAYCSYPCFQVQASCQGVVYWHNMWTLLPDGQPIVAHPIQKVEESKAPWKQQCRKCYNCVS